MVVLCCARHYPKTKATVVAETPELARLAQNTKIQSQVRLPVIIVTTCYCVSIDTAD